MVRTVAFSSDRSAARASYSTITSVSLVARGCTGQPGGDSCGIRCPGQRGGEVGEVAMVVDYDPPAGGVGRELLHVQGPGERPDRLALSVGDDPGDVLRGDQAGGDREQAEYGRGLGEGLEMTEHADFLLQSVERHQASHWACRGC